MRRAARAVRILIRDGGLPRWLRALAVVGVAPIPGPFDEAVLLVVAAWIVLNSVALIHHWDPTPFIMLNLIFSTQAAYAAPLILLAQTRQADRDKADDQRVDERHSRLELAMKGETDRLVTLLESNTQLTQQDKDLTQQIADLTKQIHVLLTQRANSAPS